MQDKWDEVNKMEPGEDFDKLIAEKVMGWLPHFRNTAFYVDADKVNSVVESHHCSVSAFCPSEEIEDAWMIVEAMRKRGNEVNLWIYEPHRGIRCMIQDANHGPQFSFKGKTAPEAICKAALLAVMP